MAIEQIMFFVLGFLSAALIAIVALPSVWKRAVRLTKKRIESATPITMTEFRAEKDQMRAEFALSTRKLERTIETQRSRVTEQLGQLNIAQNELAIAKAERNRSLSVQAELEARAAESNLRIRDLEVEIADLAQRLRGRTREIEELASLVVEEDAQPVKSTNGAIHAIRRALSFGEHQTFDAIDGLDDAYSRIAGAGSRLDALLDEAPIPEKTDTAKTPAPSLAARLSEEDALEALHDKILSVEQTIADNKSTRGNKEGRAVLRDQLSTIADMVSAIVYDKDAADDAETESLFERISKFAGQPLETPKGYDKNQPAPMAKRNTENVQSVSDRMTAYTKAHGG